MRSTSERTVYKMRATIHFRLRTVLLIFAPVLLLALAPVHLGGPAEVHARAQSSTSAQTELSDDAEASVLTVWPGDPLYSAFGHTAIRIRDPQRNLDVAYNYGTFDFESEGFYLKFLRGRLRYMLARAPTQAHLDLYRRQGRSVVEQHLALDPAQVDTLFGFLEWNYRPDNRTYRYDFFLDNCATRPRDALEHVLGDALRWQETGAGSRTFRRHLDPYLRNRPSVDTGIDLILGTPADRVAGPYDSMFLPIALKRQLGDARLGEAGSAHPLVGATDTLYWSGRPFPAEGSFPWLTAALWAVALGVIVQTGRELRDSRDEQPSERSSPRWMCRIDGLIFGGIGGAGLVVFLLWVATDHAATGPNWNLIWAWPTHLIASVPAVRNANGPWKGAYWGATALTALVTLLGWPLWPQALPAVAAPLALILFARAGHRATAGFYS